MDLEKFHERGYKGKGIKIAILDSGLGQDFQQSLNGFDEKLTVEQNDEATMNIVQIIDFTTGSRIDDESTDLLDDEAGGNQGP